MNKYRVLVATIILTSACVTQRIAMQLVSEVSGNEGLNFTAIANKYGYRVNEYDVVTEDRYILKLFHIRGDRKPPVLLMHGILDSADTYIIRGRDSLVLALAERGYDVWVCNCRGNRYSRRHVSLNPDIDKKFWDFSFHEVGYYDLPAFIDFVLNKTDQPSLTAIGQSQGNTVFYVLGSTRPEYNDKINVMIAISPVCFLTFPKPPLRALLNFGPIINKLALGFGQEELLGDETSLRNLWKAICKMKYIGYKICANGVFFLIGGSDPEEVEPEFLPTISAHYPTGSSRKNGLHFLQVANTGKFIQYDYGPSRNLELYQSAQPAEYDLKNVGMKVAMLYGENDGICSLEDVGLLRDSLPNVVEYHLIPHKNFNHLDGVWGRNMRIYLFPLIFDILDKYT